MGLRAWVLQGLASGVAAWALAGAASAYPVGERHLVAVEASAALRNADHSDKLRITVWYPAATGAVEQPLDIGPPGKPLFKAGSAAPDASFADARSRPVVLLSHGFGGTARIMAWFGTALARQGYVVVAVDHPGNNGSNPMTVPGATLFWERPGDLAAALARVRDDPAIAPHLDAGRLGVAGFSAGGFTALAAAGGRVDLARLHAFCTAHPDDGVCRPQKEFAVTQAQAEALLATPAMAGERDRASSDLSIPGVKAVFVMAPAIVQSFDPASLRRIPVPVDILLGEADPVAPPATNGEAAARTIPGATVEALPGVAHYDFLADCTPTGDAVVALCPTRVPRRRTHDEAVRAALRVFGEALK